MISIGICDDEPVVCSQLEKIILDYQSQTTEKIETDVFYSGENLVKHLIEEPSLDLIFLDIELGAINGVEIGHFIRTQMDDHITKIIYISSKNIYDRQLFDVQPLYFLPKPLEPNKVRRGIDLAFKIFGRENHSFSFKAGHQEYKIPIKEIIYFESVLREIKLVCLKKEFRFYDKLDHISQMLTDQKFMRPHQSYLINYDHAVSIKTDLILMINGKDIPVSRLRLKEIRKLQLEFEKRETSK